MGNGRELSFLQEMVYLPSPFLPVNFPHELFTTARTRQARTAAQDRARNAERVLAGAADGVGSAACFKFSAWAEGAFAEDTGQHFESAATAGGGFAPGAARD